MLMGLDVICARIHIFDVVLTYFESMVSQDWLVFVQKASKDIICQDYELLKKIGLLLVV